MPFDQPPRLLVPLWSVLLALIAPAAALAGPADTFDEQVERAVASSSSLLGLADVLALSDLAGWLPADTVAAGYQRIADEAEDRTVRDLAHYQLYRQAFSAGDLAGAQVHADALGYIHDWSFIGPFANDGMSGFTAQLPVEIDGIQLDQTYEGKVTEVAWRTTDVVSETGYFGVSDVAQPSYSAVFYAATAFDVDDDLDATLAVAIDGAYRIWLDGVPLVQEPDHLGGFAIRDEIALELDEGEHVLVVKMGTDTSIAGLHARILGADGAPLDLDYRAATTSPPLGTTTAWFMPSTLADRVADVYLAEGETDDGAVRAAVILHAMQGSDPTRPWDLYVERAVAARDALAPYQLAAISEVADAYWVRSSLIEDAASRSDDPEILLDYAANLRSRIDTRSYEEAGQVISAVLEAHPEHPRARMMYATVLREFDMPWSAFELALEVTESVDWAPSALGSLRTFAGDVHREDLYLDLYQRYIDRYANSVGAWTSLAESLRAVGRHDEVIPMLEALRETLPLSVDLLEAIAEEERGQGDTVAAQETLTEALALCPGCANLYEARGSVALEVGDRQSAIDDFEQALVLAPQDAELRALVGTLTDTGDDFYAPYRFSVEELVAMRPAEATNDYTILADQKITRVYDNGLATTYVQQAFDVHTRSGADALRATSMAYSPDSEIVEVIAVRVLKADGTVREVYDTTDYSAYSGPSSIYYDVHTRRLYFPDLDEGDLLSIEYTVADVSYRNLFDDYFGDFWFVDDYQPKVLARYGLILPPTRQIHTNAERLDVGTWTDEEHDGMRHLFFEAHDLEAVRREDLAPGNSDVFRYVSVSTYADWDTLGRWYWNLIEDQLVVSAGIEETVAELTEGLTDRREIVAAIHNYVVRNTRYVGLEFGIHGYKPYRTSDCFSRRFGDCKDTASLMNVMLEVAGIPANLVLIRTRDLGNIDGYPPSLALFNHAIAYVPEFDLFLDGTAGFSGSRELPTMDQGGSAIIVLDGEGARPVTVPMADAEVSLTATDATIDLSQSVATAHIEERRAGSFAPSTRRAYEAVEQRNEDLTRAWARVAPGITEVTSTFGDLTVIEDDVTYSVDITGGDWAQATTDGWLVRPVGLSWSLASNLAGAAERTLPVVIDYAYVAEERFAFTVPASWQPQAIPEPVTIESPFGQLAITTTFEGQTLSTDMRFVLTATTVAPEDYPDFRAFLISADDAINRVVRFNEEGVQ